MRKVEKLVNDIFRILLGSFDIFWGLFILLLGGVVGSQFMLSSCALLGVFYVIFGVALFRQEIWLKKLFILWIIPASILVVVNVRIMGELVDVSSTWHMTSFDQIGFIVLYVGIPLIFNAPYGLFNSRRTLGLK